MDDVHHALRGKRAARAEAGRGGSAGVLIVEDLDERVKRLTPARGERPERKYGP